MFYASHQHVALWSEMQRRSAKAAATLMITGYRDGKACSRTQVTFTTSRDEVGAPIFYRDVPLMPVENTKGAEEPLAAEPIPLIHWRIRDIAKAESHTVLKDMPTCANCHSVFGGRQDVWHGHRRACE